MSAKPFLPSEDSQPEWYGSKEQPLYSPGLTDEPLSSEENVTLDRLARRFVSNWLEVDNHGFQIPGGPWGQDLLWSLRRLLAATNPSFTTVAFYPEHATSGQEQPWLLLHTDEHAWAEALPSSISIPLAVGGSASFTIRKAASTPAEADAIMSEGYRIFAHEVTDYSLPRFPAYYTGVTSEELDGIVQERLELFPQASSRR